MRPSWRAEPKAIRQLMLPIHFGEQNRAFGLAAGAEISRAATERQQMLGAALRARAKITSHFRIPSSGHLWPRLNHKILEIALLFLWFCSIGATKSNQNLSANSVNLFLREPLPVYWNTLRWFCRCFKGFLIPSPSGLRPPSHTRIHFFCRRSRERML